MRKKACDAARRGDFRSRIARRRLAAAVAALVLGCGRPPAEISPSAEAQPTAIVPSVRIVRPERKTVRHPIEQPGFNIEAFQETALYAKIAGYVRQWNADIGDDVRKGDALAVLSVPEMEVDLNQKEALVRQAAAQILQSEAALLTAKAQLERSKSQFERLARIGKGGVLDQENVDEARLGYEAAKAALEKAKADVAATKAQLEVAKANRNYSKTMLDYATIRAPYDGVVTQRNVDTGAFVQPAAGGMKGRPLFVVYQIDPVRVFVNVPGSDASWIKDGDPVTLRLQGAGGEVIEGKVTRNARSLDPQARTLRTEIDLPNPRRKLLPGMYVQASITVEHENVWTLPSSAILTDGDQVYCFRAVGGRAARCPLQIGLKGNGLVEVLMKQAKFQPSNREQAWTPITGDEEIVAIVPPLLTHGESLRIVH